MSRFPLKSQFALGALSATILLSQWSVANAQAPDNAPQTAPVTRVVGPTADAGVQKIADAMLSALQNNNRGEFVAPADDNFKAALTPALFKSAVDSVAPRLNGGYEARYLGEMKKAGFTVHLWVLSFSDKGDDMLVNMSLKDGKVGGFFVA